jgi:hypothetical protein
MSITIEPGQLGARLRSDGNGLPKVIQRAMFSAAQRGKAFIVDKSPVDRGILRNAWRIVKMSDGVELINDQPYAGVMEAGARPFKIGRAGLDALKAWVYRKILNGTIVVNKIKNTRHRKLVKWNLEDEASSIAWAISKKFEKVGIKGRRFVYSNLPKLAALMDSEVNRVLGRFFNRATGSGTP